MVEIQLIASDKDTVQCIADSVTAVTVLCIYMLILISVSKYCDLECQY